MKKNLIVFGTRPEAIKMIPLVKKFKEYPELFSTKVCVTAQHREMLDQVLDFFDILPDYDLDIMRPDQDLYLLTSTIIEKMKYVLHDFKPDYVFIHGDTTTTMAAAISAFYSGAKVCHVEAGLRTNNKLSPFPEEMNRQVAGRIADYHFAPTIQSKNNLLKENIVPETILVTGNTVIDALLESSIRVENYSSIEIENLKQKINFDHKIILVTGHRRENHGQGFINICNALKEIAFKYPEVQIVYPVHLNPKVKNIVYETLSGIDNVFLISPLSYPAFVWLMKKCYILLTDSGGVQEEAPSLGKPVLVMRNTTERHESVEAGTVTLVGSSREKIVYETKRLIEDEDLYKKTSKKNNPYGDGKASQRIVDFIAQL